MNSHDSILDAEILETPAPAMPYAATFVPMPVPASRLAPSAGSPNWLTPLLLAGGGVAALGMLCVFGLVLLVGLAATLEGDASGGSDYAGGAAAASSSDDWGGSHEDRMARATAELGGSFNMDSNAVGTITTPSR
jgi:hypothetical protein